MTRDKPTVSIGLPVFNGENYLEEALNSILAQSYRDFELIISDNASTDRTQQICRAYAAKDNRIRYYRNKINVGASKNFNRVFELSTGKYFRWASHDDILAPDLLSECVEILDSNPSIVLCYSKTGQIDEHVKLVGSYTPNCRVYSEKPNERFGDLISMRFPSWVIIFGLMRSSALKNTQLFGDYIGVDRNLLAELALVGRFYELSDYLFFRRAHDQAYTNKRFISYHEQLDWWVKTSSRARLYFPNWRILREYVKSIKRIPLKWSERQLCYYQIFKWLLREGWVFLCWDIGINVVEHSKYKKWLAPLKKYFIQHGGL